VQQARKLIGALRRGKALRPPAIAAVRIVRRVDSADRTVLCRRRIL